MKRGEERVVSIPGGSTTGQDPFSTPTKYLQEEALLIRKKHENQRWACDFFSCAIQFTEHKKINKNQSIYLNIRISAYTKRIATSLKILIFVPKTPFLAPQMIFVHWKQYLWPKIAHLGKILAAKKQIIRFFNLVLCGWRHCGDHRH